MIKNFSFKRFFILLLFVLYGSILICGLIYIVLNDEVEYQRIQIDSLVQQIEATSSNLHDL